MPAAVEAADSNGRRAVRALASLLLLAIAAFALRAYVLERTFPPRLLGDEMYYVVVASNLAAGRGHVYGKDARALRPPAHAWLLSRVTEPDVLMDSERTSRTGRRGVHLAALRPLLGVEVALGTALVVVTALLGWGLFDRRTGLVAGAMAAVYPTLVAYSHLLWAETLFALLITSALAALVWMERRQVGWPALGVGALFGAAALTREIALPVAVAAVFWAVVTAEASRRRAAAFRGIGVLIAATLVVLPWVLRNHAELGRILPISSVGWIAIGEGNSLEGRRWLRPAAPARSVFRSEVNAVSGEVERSEFARRRALEMIAEAQPAWILTKLAHNVPLLLSPDAFHLYKLRNGSYGDVPDGTRRAVAIATVLAYAVVACLGAIGIASARRGNRRLLALLVLGCVLALHVVANANSRFRMPWMPLVIVFAAHAVLGGRPLVAGLRPMERGSAILASAAVIAICLSYMWLDWSAVR
jgi:4-amino-4-deoxy-L-arabinose transferase-like glycosyltransferase